MPALFTHKNQYIHVRVMQDSYGRGLFRPLVDVGPKGGNHQMNLGTSRVFADKKDAEECGFELGREWIDKTELVATTPPLQHPVTKHALTLIRFTPGGV